MKLTIPLTVLALALAGCEAQAPTQADESPSTPRPAPPAPPSAPPPAPPVLSALSRADFEDRLKPGFGCNLSRDGADLLVAVSGDAVAKVDGTVTDLTGAPLTLDAMARGGRYTGGAATIAIDPARGGGDAPDEASRKRVSVTVTSAGRSETFEATWTCGS